MRICRNCEHARQCGDMKRTDVVGCAAFMDENITVHDVKNEGNIYQGYAYPKRRPGDNIPTKPNEIGRGAIVYTYLLDDVLTCKHFSPREDERYPLVTSD